MKKTGSSKYKNQKVEVDGEKFDSKKEQRRYEELKTLLAAGQISELSRQHTIRCESGGVLICRYVADFTYLLPDGERVVEDVKSPITRKNPVYRIKKKLVKALHGVDILET